MGPSLHKLALKYKCNKMICCKCSVATPTTYTPRRRSNKGPPPPRLTGWPPPAQTPWPWDFSKVSLSLKKKKSYSLVLGHAWASISVMLHHWLGATWGKHGLSFHRRSNWKQIPTPPRDGSLKGDESSTWLWPPHLVYLNILRDGRSGILARVLNPVSQESTAGQ